MGKVYVIVKTVRRSEKYQCQAGKVPKENNGFCKAQDILQLVYLIYLWFQWIFG